MPFEESAQAAVTGHAALAGAGVPANVLERADVLRRKGIGNHVFRDAKAAADVAQAAVTRAGIRKAAAVHTRLRTPILRISLNKILAAHLALSSVSDQFSDVLTAPTPPRPAAAP